MAEHRYNLRGEVDLEAAPRIRADLADVVSRGEEDLLVDCTRLAFIDSTGITVLLEANERLRAAGRHMLICNVPSRCRRVFEVLGLTDLLRYDRPAP